MNAVDILTNDHRQVDAMIAELEQAGSGSNQGVNFRHVFARLVDALSVHMKVEEEILYPAMRQFEDDKDLVVEAYDEHNEVKSLLTQMNELDPASPEFQSNLKMVKTGIQHHVSEEEGELFPDAQEKLGEARLMEIGKQIMQLKSQNDRTNVSSATL